MPPRRPLKARQLLWLPAYQFSVVQGLSSRLLADIHLLDLDSEINCGVYECCGHPLEARHLLRKVVSALPGPTARELRRFVAKTAERHAA